MAAICLFVYSACSSDDEVIPEPEPTYSVVEVKYTLEEASDSVAFQAHVFDPVGFINGGTDSMSVTWTETPRDLVMTSWFSFSPALPEYLEVDTVTVRTPEWVRGKEIDTVERGWTLAEGKHMKPYWSSAMVTFTETLSFTVPPHKEITINRTSKEEVLQATVELVVENDQTGERTSYQGKWIGTLRFPEHATKLTDNDWPIE